MLDGSINPLPKHVYMLGMEYTPLEFTHSVCMPDEYMAFTSFTHEPMNKKVALKLTDNYNDERFVNLPIDRLMELMEKSVSLAIPYVGRATSVNGDSHSPTVWQMCRWQSATALRR